MSTFQLNVTKALQDKDLPGPIRDLYMTLRNVGFITPGDFFESLSQADLDVLRHIADDFGHTHSDKSIEALMLLGMGLAMGEGLDLTEDLAMDGVTIAVLYISLEMLGRAGLCKVMRKNWSMDKTLELAVAARLDDESV